MKTIFKNTNLCFKNQSKLNISMIEKTTSPNVTFLSYSKIALFFISIFIQLLLQEPQHRYQLQVQQPLIEAWFSCTISPKTTSTFAKLGIWFLHWPEIIRISLKVLLPWSFKVSKWRIITWISSDFWPCWLNCQVQEVLLECLVLPGMYIPISFSGFQN